MLGSLQRNFEWKRTELCFNKNNVAPTSCEWKKKRCAWQETSNATCIFCHKINAESLRRNSRAWRRQWNTQNANYRIFPQLQGLYKLYVPWLVVEKIPNKSTNTQKYPFILHDEGSLREDLCKLKSLSFATNPHFRLSITLISFPWV